MQTFLPLIILHFNCVNPISYWLLPSSQIHSDDSCLSELPSSFIIGIQEPFKIDPFYLEWQAEHQLSFDFMQPFLLVLHLLPQQASSFSWRPSAVSLARPASSVRPLHARCILAGAHREAHFEVGLA